MSDTQPVQSEDPIHVKIEVRAYEIWCTRAVERA